MIMPEIRGRLLRTQKPPILVIDEGIDLLRSNIGDAGKAITQCHDCSDIYYKLPEGNIRVVMDEEKRIIAVPDIYLCFKDISDIQNPMDLQCPVCFLGKKLEYLEEFNFDDTREKLNRILPKGKIDITDRTRAIFTWYSMMTAEKNSRN